MKEDIQQHLTAEKMHGYTVHRKERVEKNTAQNDNKTNRYGGGSSGD